MTSKGQVTVPVEVRNRLGLKAGDRVDFVYLPDGGVALRTRKIPFEALAGILKSKRKRPLSVREMDLAIARHLAEKHRRIMKYK